MRRSFWLEFLRSPYSPLQISEEKMNFSPQLSDCRKWVNTRENVYTEAKKLHRKIVAATLVWYDNNSVQ